MIIKNALHFLRILRVSLRALARNKMRTFLTCLGIIIGVGAVIAMVSIGAGARAAVEKRFENMGTNLLSVRGGSRNIHGVRTGASGWVRLTVEDANAIAQLPAVEAVSPSVGTRAQVVYLNKNWSTQIQGTGQDYLLVRKWELEQGTYFDESMVRSAAKVCVIGSDVLKNLFDEGEDPLGKTIRISRVPFMILGVFKSKGDTGGFGSRDDFVAIPYTTAMKRLQRADNIQSIDVSAMTAALTIEAKSQIEDLLRIRHRIPDGGEDDFTVMNMAEIAEGAADATNILTILLGSIASISLLVGGIGIMNIMLVSVTERIREIGIRMSVGAKERDILLQFLAEAIVLSMMGGLLGIGLGVGISRLMKYVPMFSTIQAVVTPGSVLLAFLFSASVGIFFGFYPARKASKLDPIEALRYE
ncbi:MAG: FtsX-like permease family protein [Candidatus Aminicenantes bacterium]|nr:FtsX-like permease family protein [Candidatus Aminicenantes bacterium]